MWNCASGFMVKKLTQKVSDFWLTLDSIKSCVFLFVFIIMSVYSSIYLSLCKSFFIIMHFLFRHTGKSLNLIYLSICCTYCISTFLYSLAQNFRVSKIFIKCRHNGMPHADIDFFLLNNSVDHFPYISWLFCTITVS